MMTLKISNYKKILNINNGCVYELVVENPYEYYSIGRKIIDNDDSIVVYDGDIKDNDKYILCVSNLFDIDPNTKKNLSSTYKKLVINCNNDEVNRMVSEINQKTFELFELISQEFDSSITYDTDVQLLDLLTIYNFKYNNSSNLFLNNFVSFIKASLQNTNYKLIIVFNLFDFINTNDFELLKKEFALLDLCLLNVCAKKSQFLFDDRIIIDKDLCEI
jgi:CRISPR type II-A/NMEMI-associated protein Csn2